MPSGVTSASGTVAVAIDGLFASCATSIPPVSPETRLIAPGAEGPNVVPYELSLIAKCCASFQRPVTVLPS